jgi:hypothetical protein
LVFWDHWGQWLSTFASEPDEEEDYIEMKLKYIFKAESVARRKQ